MAMDFLAVGVFQAVGKGSLSLLMAVFRKLIFEIPALFLLNIIFPLYGIAFALLFKTSSNSPISVWLFSNSFFGNKPLYLC